MPQTKINSGFLAYSSTCDDPLLDPVRRTSSRYLVRCSSTSRLSDNATSDLSPLTRPFYSSLRRLVDDLGLHSDLAQYKVPKEDAPKIAEKAMGNRDDPSFPKVVKLLENLYPA